MDEARRCTATARSGQRCKKAAIKGGKVCRMHGGVAPQVKAKAAERAQADLARLQCERLGIAVATDPGEALLSQVAEAAGNVEFYRARAAELGLQVTDLVFTEGGSHSVPHVLVVLYNQERDRLVNFSVAALRAGVEERRVRMAEADARRLAEVVVGALADISAPAELAERFRAALGARLRALPVA